VGRWDWMDSIRIRPADLPSELETVRGLFREYAASLDTDLCFQNFEAELASLPGKYSPPEGRLLVALQGEEAIACVALRAIDGEICEMKRLYVRPSARGVALGRRLVERICDEAREAGYRRMYLDTLPSMAKAIRLYRELGFQSIPPYTHNPVPGAVFLALDL
jgi:ribosomal protein S18 acetylase RimI-like enzyme